MRFEVVVDEIWLIVIVIDTIEGATGGTHRQGGDVQMFAIWGSSGDTGCDTNTDIADSTQFLHRSVDLRSIRSLRIENRFRIVEDYEHLL